MIGIIGAMSVETDELIGAMQSTEKSVFERFEFVVGKLHGKEIVVCRCGIGKVHAATAAALMVNKYPQIDILISIGVAGGLYPLVRQGDVVIANKTVYHDFDSTADGVEKGRVSGLDFTYFRCDEKSVALMEKIMAQLKVTSYTGTIATGDMFVGSDEKAAQIREEFGAYACDMESAAIAQTAYLTNRKFLSMRAISDNGDGSAIGDFYSFVTKAAKVSTNAIIKFVEAY